MNMPTCIKSVLCFTGIHDDQLVAKWTDKDYALILSEYVCSGCHRRRMYVELFEPERCAYMGRIGLDNTHTMSLDEVNKCADITREINEQTHAETEVTEPKKRVRKTRTKTSGSQNN